MKLIMFLTFLIFQANVKADEAKRIIVKFKKVPNEVIVKNGSNLFDQIYVFQNKNFLKIKSLINKDDVEYIQEENKAEKRELAKKAEIISEKNFQNLGNPFNDPLISKVWSFADASSGGVSVNKYYKNVNGKSIDPIIVAVVDTGVDFSHEDLKEVMWNNPDEIPNNGIDDDQNGYIDDIYGINTLVRDSNGKATTNVLDTHSHGTHVSGTIAAKQNNNKGIAGIASNALIMALRTVPNNGDETDVDVAEAFIYAAKNGAKLINCSFGKYKNEGGNLIPDTLKHIAQNYGVLVVAAAGNESSDIDKRPTYPASFDNDNLLIIASTAKTGSLSGFSNYGKVNVDVAAPGSSIYSTVPKNSYESMSGTSMATPTTVGVLAELWSQNPQLSYKELKDLIMQTVSQNSNFKNKMQSGGRIDLYNAFNK